VVDAASPMLLAGRYELGAMLGYGGMAEVFRGRDVRLGRDVAVKVLRADLARDPSFLTRFRREAQSAAGLSHPAIVSVYDTGEGVLDETPGSPTVPFIVMEYVEGRTLREVLQAEGRLQPRRAVEIVAEVCAALACSHEAGVVHRDIKPGNVMITRTGLVKVMDFGIARAVTASSSAVTQTAAVMGTAQYLSPEQARGEHVDARSDIYSTGCLLYELLTGRPPFLGDSPVAVAYQHVREDPTPPSQLDPDLPADLDAVVLKAMAKNPVNRYQTAADMGADLERVSAGRRVLATPVLAVREERTTVLTPAPAAVQTTVLAPREDERRPSRALAYSLLALAVVAIFVGAALGIRALLDKGGSSTLKMPAVTGQRLSDAQRVLADNGLVLGQVVREFQKDGKIPRDQVLKQVPGEGFSIKRGQVVTLTVSDGQQMVQVPAVLGQQLADAKSNIEAAGLKLGMVTMSVADLRTAPGTVQGVGPAQGATVVVGSTVTLKVASDQARLPDVRGLAEADAVARLQSAGFVIGVRRTVSSDSQAPGSIIATDPQGATATRGATVNYSVAVTPPPPSPTAPPSRTAPPSPTAPATPPASTVPATTPAPSPATSSPAPASTQPAPTTAAPTP